MSEILLLFLRLLGLAVCWNRLTTVLTGYGNWAIPCESDHFEQMSNFVFKLSKPI